MRNYNNYMSNNLVEAFSVNVDQNSQSVKPSSKN